jgi:hypothetical protein
VCACAREIGRTFHGFRDIVSVFRVLGSLTRIETARLGAAGAEFGNLAEEVNALTRSIESNGQGILDDASMLHRHMQSALAKITGLRATELKEMPAIVAGDDQPGIAGRPPSACDRDLAPAGGGI